MIPRAGGLMRTGPLRAERAARSVPPVLLILQRRLRETPGGVIMAWERITLRTRLLVGSIEKIVERRLR